MHIQRFPCQITKTVERDDELKFARAMRIILSFLSTTKYRTIVKKALKGTYKEKIIALRDIDISEIDDLGKNNQTLADFYKALAFQAGQCIALADNREVYTKSEIIKLFPKFEDALMRKENCDKNDINWIKNYLLDISDLFYSRKDLVEHTNWRNKNEIY